MMFKFLSKLVDLTLTIYQRSICKKIEADEQREREYWSTFIEAKKVADKAKRLRIKAEVANDEYEKLLADVKKENARFDK